MYEIIASSSRDTLTSLLLLLFYLFLLSYCSSNYSRTTLTKSRESFNIWGDILKDGENGHLDFIPGFSGKSEFSQFSIMFAIGFLFCLFTILVWFVLSCAFMDVFISSQVV